MTETKAVQDQRIRNIGVGTVFSLDPMVNFTIPVYTLSLMKPKNFALTLYLTPKQMKKTIVITRMAHTMMMIRPNHAKKPKGKAHMSAYIIVVEK